MAALFLAATLIAAALPARAEPFTLSARLVHRFSGEAIAETAARGVPARWPSRGTAEYFDALVRSDLARMSRSRIRVSGAPVLQALFPVEGSEARSLGNDFGWLHYTWIDIGTPNISFLVALDAGSDLLWVPCDCIQCAPLSTYRGDLDKDLGMYSPDESRTSKRLSCSHELCALGPTCTSPKQPCPYTVNYYSENTSSSGLLVEDTLYLMAAVDHSLVQADVIIGCGRRQSGGYLDGIAPDGLLGLGFGDLSVPSILARSGLVRNSFSLCFRDDDSGRIFFGDEGNSTQQTTPFVAFDGKFVTYVVEVESFFIGNQFLGKTSFQAIVDSGSSFTFLPNDVYKRVSTEFDKQVNSTRLVDDQSPWEYCYKASALEMPVIPAVILVFAVNRSFIATNPVFLIYDGEGELAGFCLALQSSRETLGTIGQNLMTGYHMIFDREKMMLGWSHSDCYDIENNSRLPLTPPLDLHNKTESPLPSDEQRTMPAANAISPAVVVMGSHTDVSAASWKLVNHSCLYLLLMQVNDVGVIIASTRAGDTSFILNV